MSSNPVKLYSTEIEGYLRIKKIAENIMYLKIIEFG
jgi:hypothetical protein